MPLPTPDRLAEAADPPTPAARAPGVLAADALLIDRELSLLHFNRRVLALAEQPDLPVLERLRYLAIVGGNLDEFFEIRVAGLRGALRSSEPPPGMSLHEVRVEYTRIAASAHGLVEQHYRGAQRFRAAGAAASAGSCSRPTATGRPAERAYVAGCFEREIRPLLTPIGLDPAHPFPQIASKTLNFVVELSGRDAFGRETSMAIVKVPRVLPAALRLPHEVSGTTRPSSCSPR